jgi:hypothetical protein
MDRPITVQIPLHYVGTPEGVKNDGGILQVIRRSVQIRALPSDLPEFIEVDITGNSLIEKSLQIREKYCIFFRIDIRRWDDKTR